MANYYLTFFIMFTTLASTKAVANCSDDGPQIKSPFYTKPHRSSSPEIHDHDHDHDSAAFELHCTKTGATTIRFPSYSAAAGELTVKSISYGGDDVRRLDLADTGNCVHGVFLNLDLSLTPFRYYYRLKNYTYLNCTDELPSSFVEIPCLSGDDHHVYTVEPSTAVPSSCRVIGTVGIPFEYSPYLADNSFGLGLTWDDQKQEHKLLKSGIIGCFTFGLVLGLSISIMILAIKKVVSTIRTSFYSNKLSSSVHPREGLNQSQAEGEKYFGDYKSCSADHEADVERVSDLC